MSTYMTEEEQLEAIKGWWKKHGNNISTLVLIIMVIIAGFRYYQWHQHKQQSQASALYEQMMVAASNQDDKDIESRANKLVQDYGKSIYGEAAKLTLSKLSVERKDYKLAIKQLNSVIAGNRNAALTQVAKLRLSRVLMATKKYDEALKAIESVSSDSYLSLISELRGDIFTAQGDFAKAKTAYEAALTSSRKQRLGNLFLEMKTNDVARLQVSEQSHIKNA